MLRGSATDGCHLGHLGDGSARLLHEGACLHLESLAIKGIVEVGVAKATICAIHCFHDCYRFVEICELHHILGIFSLRDPGPLSEYMDSARSYCIPC